MMHESQSLDIRKDVSSVVSQMTYPPVDFMVLGMWCWPPDWDGIPESFDIFDCPALWVQLRYLDEMKIESGTIHFDFKISDDVMTCWHNDDNKRCVWKFREDYDMKNNARLMVWPD